MIAFFEEDSGSKEVYQRKVLWFSQDHASQTMKLQDHA